MKRAVAAALLSLTFAGIMEMPKGCGSGGSGDINHPDVSAAPAPEPTQAKTKARNERSYPTPEKPRRNIRFQVIMEPKRTVDVTWTVSGPSTAGAPKGNVLVLDRVGQWGYIHIGAESGDLATLFVENRGVGGLTQCAIYVDEKLLLPNPAKGEHWNPYMHRNDAGDCDTSVIVP